MRISDLCSDVCSSDLRRSRLRRGRWLLSFLLLPLAVRGGGDALAGLAGVVVGGAKQGLEGIELPVPEAFVMADPFRAGVQGACVEVAGVHAARTSRWIRPARSSTWMCLEAPASEISNGAASSPTVRGCSARACSMARRVGSERAWNTPSRCGLFGTSGL